jgi:hypothetical protein
MKLINLSEIDNLVGELILLKDKHSTIVFTIQTQWRTVSSDVSCTITWRNDNRDTPLAQTTLIDWISTQYAFVISENDYNLLTL